MCPLDDGASVRTPAPKVWKTLDLSRTAAEFLAKKGIDAPRLTAELLLCHALGCERIDLYTRFDTAVTSEQLSAFRELIRRRAAHVPTQYLTESCEFMSLSFCVGEGVLIPRPETEFLVQACIDVAREMERPLLADVGTGCGAIAVAFVHELPAARAVATDISPTALEFARKNADRHGVAERVQFLEGDLLEPLRRSGRSVDILASNPPYVAQDEFADLPPEIREHEPREALVAGPRGTEFHRRIIHEAGDVLAVGGYLALELPDGKAAEIVDMISDVPFEGVRLIEDHAGSERVLLAKRSEESIGETHIG